MTNITGSENDDILVGGSGDDVIEGLAGRDHLYGGEGNDYLDGGYIRDPLIVKGDGNNWVYGEGGNDVLYGADGIDHLDGGEGDDELYGIGGNDVLYGREGNDRLTDGAGDDVLYGDAGDDYLLAEGGNDVLYGGEGNDSLGSIYDGSDILDGGVGDDTLAGGRYDTLIGGDGIDEVTLDLSWMTTSLNFSAAAMIGSVEVAPGTVVQGIEHLRGLLGGSANDTIDLSGASAGGVIDGGSGTDRLIVNAATRGVITVLNFEILVANWSASNTEVVFGPTNFVANGFTIASNGFERFEFTGGSYDDQLTGYLGADILSGGLGNDTIDGGSDVDSMLGGAGDDTYVIDNVGDRVYETTTTASLIDAGGVDTIQSSISTSLDAYAGVRFVERLTLTGTANLTGTGNALDNLLIGNSGNNTLSGLGGNDTLDGGAGTDGMSGGSGDDTYIVDNVGDRVYETTTPISGIDTGGLDTIFSSVTMSLDAYAAVRFVENLTLTGAASINGDGNALANRMIGNSGNNTLNGGLGNDTMGGGAGNDIYVVDSINDQVFETTTIASLIDAGGIDTIQSSVALNLDANAGLRFVERLTLTGASNIDGVGNALANVMLGNSGNNTLDGGLGVDLMVGGAGNDVYVVDNAGDRVFETTTVSTQIDAGGVDTMLSSISTSLDAYIGVRFVENMTLTGTGNLVAVGNALANELIGNTGNNTLNGGLGADTMGGGAGNDTYVVDNVGDQVFETTTVSSGVDAGGIDIIQSSVSLNLDANAGLRFVERLTLTGTGNINGDGNALANVLLGNSGNNTLDGDLGADIMGGGAGNDIYIVDNIADFVFETTTISTLIDAGGVDTVLSSVTTNLDAGVGARFVENLTLTGAANINGTGNALANVLIGNSGNNTLNGGLGNDTMIGGAGNDIYIVDSISDQVFETTTISSLTDAGGVDTIQSSVTTSLDANAGVRFVERLTLTGTANISGLGNTLDNVLLGNSGNNTLNGGLGNDTMGGSAGDDIYIVDSVNDRVFETTTISSLIDAGGVDTIQSSLTTSLDAYAAVRFVENLSLTGAGNIDGTGNGLANVLTGNSGNNTLKGGLGNDTMGGGAGNDTFVFVTGDGADTISDFASGDKINLTGVAGVSGFSNLVFVDDIPNNRTTIDFGNGNTITILGKVSANLTAGDFVFTASANQAPTLSLTNVVLSTPENGAAVKVANIVVSDDGIGTNTLSLTGADAASFSIVGNELRFNGAADFETKSSYNVTVNVDDATLGAGVDSTQNVTLAISNVSGSQSGNGDNNTIDGTSEEDTLSGLGGNDVLSGFVGADILDGGEGNDGLNGGAGADVLIGGAGNDFADYGASPVGLVVDLLTPSNNTGEAAGDSYSGVENLRGSAFADNLRGDNANNFLEGRAGADVLNGRGGSDSASYQNAAAGVTASLATPNVNTGEAAGDTYIAIEHLAGSAFNDVLTGDAGNNNLRGNAGADALDGGAGLDTADYLSLGGTTGVTADLGNSANNTGIAAGDTYVSIENLRGTNFADILRGDANINVLEGGAGADVLDGGGTGLDYASYQSSTTAIVANLGNAGLNTGDAAGDTYIGIRGVFGSIFADTLTGDGQDNFLRGGLGADALDGGAGDDYADYQGSSSGLTVNLANVALNTGEAAGDTFVSIERIRGSNFNDVLVGDELNNFLRGGLGADVLDGGAGDDWADYFTATAGLTVNLANAALNTGEAAGDTFVSMERIRGSNFNDTLTGDAQSNFLRGGLGADSLDGGAGSDWADYQGSTSGVTVNLANAALNAGEAAGDTFVSIERVRGSDFNDSLVGDAQSNFLRGGLGADALEGGAGSDVADYSTSSVGLTVDLQTATNNTGEAAGDSYLSIENLRGSAFADDLRGDNVGNFLEGGEGGDILNGRGGGDFATYQNATSSVTASLANATVNTGEAAGDTYISIEHLAGSAFDDVLTGDANNNFLRGNAGADVLDGGAGFDTADYGGLGTTSGATADLANSANNTGNAFGDTYISIENLRGSNFDDVLRGDANNNVLEGGAGADVLDGGAAGFDFASYQNSATGLTVNLANTSLNTGDAAGDTYINIRNLFGSNFADTLVGDSQDNVLRGGAGADALNGGIGSDAADYQSSFSGLTVNLANAAANTGEAAGDTFTSIENIRGSNFNDILVGDAQNNILRGSAGADALDGAGGSDTAEYFNAAAGLTADIANATANNTGEAAGDTYVSIENLRGSAFNDVLRGDGGANTLRGEAGADFLVGRGGGDILFGGAGADTFVYATGDGADTISDFASDDTIDLRGFAGVNEFADLIFTDNVPNNYTTIDLGGGDTITILNQISTGLSVGDFLFTL